MTQTALKTEFNKMSDKHPLKTFRVRLKGEVYDRVYGISDLENLLNLFNEMHNPQMTVIIEEINEEK